MNAAEAETALRTRGLTLTPQRRAVLRFLEGNTGHPTAQQIFVAVTADFPVTSRATVYNTLQLLGELGLVRLLRTGDEVRYDPCVTPHHHLTCTRCGALVDVPAERVRVQLDGHAAVRSEVWFDGVCAACSALA